MAKSVKIVVPFIILGFLPLLGCENAKEAIGLTKQAPDEFAIVTRAPLNIPPQFDLRPPKPGSSRPQETTPRSEARKILLKNTSRRGILKKNKPIKSGKFSDGEAAFLQRADALTIDSTIRKVIKKESSGLTAVNKGLLKKILFWQQKEELGKVIDATKEARRLRKITSQGEPLTKGETPVITRKKKGWLEGIF